MKVNRTFILLDQDKLSASPDWQASHKAICDAIGKVAWPLNSPDGRFTLHRIITLKPGAQFTDAQGREATWGKQATNIRNGVVPIRQAFRRKMEESIDWKAEEPLSLRKFFENTRKDPLISQITLYPSSEVVTEALNESVGEFDFWFKSVGGFRVIVEWETGNISSSHRSLNKMCLALMGDITDAAVLIVPSGAMAPHLTDRIGNIKELEPYFYFWQSVAARLKRGILAVIEVEQDELVNTMDLRAFIPSGFDGNSKKKAKKAPKRARK